MDALIQAFQESFGFSPTHTAHAPGRVNLLGEHIDYNDGPVLPVAIDLAVSLAAAPGEHSLLELQALDLGEQVSLRLDSLDDKVDTSGAPLPDWARYPAGAAWALHRAGFNIAGLRVAYQSSIPIGAGLSSSAAVLVGFAALWQEFGGWSMERLELAKLCKQAENDYLGLSCGLMDHFASACGAAGHALYLDTHDLSWQTVPLPEDAVLVVADSGVRRSLTESHYNQRQAECQAVVEALRQYIPDLRSLRQVKATEFAAFGYYLPETLRKRGEHVVKEIARVESALSALLRDDRQALGALMYAGHKSLRDLYEVSTPELDILVELARGLPGTIGARLTGAGFGGCTVNLVEADHELEFKQGLAEGYFNRTGKTAQLYTLHASAGVEVKRVQE